MGTNRFTLVRKETDGTYYATIYDMPNSETFRSTDELLVEWPELLKQIGKDYAATEEGKKIVAANNGVFGWNDFAEIPDKFLEKYGVEETCLFTGITEVVDASVPILGNIPKRKAAPSNLNLEDCQFKVIEAGRAFPAVSGKVISKYSCHALLERIPAFKDKFAELCDLSKKWFNHCAETDTVIPADNADFYQITDADSFLVVVNYQKFNYIELQAFVLRLFAITRFQTSKPGDSNGDDPLQKIAMNNNAFKTWIKEQIKAGTIEIIE